MKHVFSALSTLMVSVFLLGGCMGYQLDGTIPKGIETVHVAPVINKTTEPAIEIKVDEALRQRIQFDGRVRIAPPDQADAIVEVTLTDYDIRALSYSKEKESRAREYRVTVKASAVLRNQKTNEIISTTDSYGEATFPFDSGLTESKRIAFPAAAADLSKFLIDGLLEDW